MKETQKLKLRSSLKTLLNLKNDPVLLLIILFSLALVTFFILIPLYNILLASITVDKGLSLKNYSDVFSMYGNKQILLNTIKLGLVTASISVMIGFLFAYVSSPLHL